MIDFGKLEELFEKHNDEYLKFERVKNKLNKRPDLNSFLLFDKIMNDNDEGDIIGCSHHDEYYLSIDQEAFCEKATEEQLIDLIRCGVRYDEDSFCMFA